MNDYRDPVPTRASKASVYAYAEEAAKKLSYVSGGSIKGVVSRLGGSIEHSDPFEEDIPESILVDAKGDFTIFISSLTSTERDRFTIAHELGHYLLHYPKLLAADPRAKMKATRWVDASEEALVRAEWEANWFAAAFLMPKTEFRAKWVNDGKSKAAEHFGVSEAAAEIRAKSLELF